MLLQTCNSLLFTLNFFTLFRISLAREKTYLRYELEQYVNRNLVDSRPGFDFVFPYDAYKHLQVWSLKTVRSAVVCGLQTKQTKTKNKTTKSLIWGEPGPTEQSQTPFPYHLTPYQSLVCYQTSQPHIQTLWGERCSPRRSSVVFLLRPGLPECMW